MHFINRNHISVATVTELEVALNMANGTLIILDGSKDALLAFVEGLSGEDSFIKVSEDLNLYFRTVTQEAR